MDYNPLYILVLAIVAFSITAVCFYLITVLKELKKTIERTNMMLDDLKNVSEFVSDPVGNVKTLLLSAISAYKSTKSKNLTESEED